MTVGKSSIPTLLYIRWAITTTIQPTRPDSYIRDPSSGNLERDPRPYTHEQRSEGAKDFGLMRFGGNLVDETQSKTPLLFG